MIAQDCTIMSKLHKTAPFYYTCNLLSFFFSHYHFLFSFFIMIFNSDFFLFYRITNSRTLCFLDFFLNTFEFYCNLIHTHQNLFDIFLIFGITGLPLVGVTLVPVRKPSLKRYHLSPFSLHILHVF